MAQAGMSISSLIAALSYGKEIQEIKQKFCTELEQEEEVLSLRTKAEVRELAEDISNKIVKLFSTSILQALELLLIKATKAISIDHLRVLSWSFSRKKCGWSGNMS